MATLATPVHVTDDEGVTHVFGPADDVPAWAQARITNPKAWAEAPTVTAPEPAPTPAPVKKAPAKRAPARRKAAADGAVSGG